MADYYTDTVVRPFIPETDINSLERKLLDLVFESDEVPLGEITKVPSRYFYSRQSFNLPQEIDVEDLTKWINEVPQDELTEHFKEVISELPPEKNEFTRVEFEMEDLEVVFQSIIKRSETLDYITLEHAFTCSKHRPDGFGGASAFITEDKVEYMSTRSFLDKCLSEASDTKKWLENGA